MDNGTPASKPSRTASPAKDEVVEVNCPCSFPYKGKFIEGTLISKNGSWFRVSSLETGTINLRPRDVLLDEAGYQKIAVEPSSKKQRTESTVSNRHVAAPNHAIAPNPAAKQDEFFADLDD